MAKPAIQPAPVPSSLEELFVASAEAAGWTAVAEPVVGHQAVDALISKGKYRYVVELKVASEGRRDRLVAFLSQAILQARSFAVLDARRAKPLAVIAAPRIHEPVVKALQDFAQEHAPDVAIGIIDLDGRRVFVGPGLESLNAASKPPAMRTPSVPERSIDLFSDLNQWMLKVLLAPDIDRAGLMPVGLPRSGCRNASELAKSAHVSVMSAFRFVRQLEREGFLHESRDRVRLVRLDALLQRWQSVGLKPARELHARWILARADDQLQRAVESLGGRACVGLFSAARALGLGHVQGVPVHVYMNDFRPESLRKADLMRAASGDRVDVVLRVPLARESVFRGVVNIDGLPVSDVLQVWLDVSAHPARGKQQADLIHRRVIEPMMVHVNASSR